MGIHFLDGKGRGYLAEVDSDNRVRVSARSQEEIEVVSETDGQAFTWTNLTYNYTGADTILLVKNTGDTPLHILSIECSGDTATEVIVHVPTTEVTPTGTAVTGFNLNLGSGNVAEATAIADETNNTQGDIVYSQRMLASTVLPIMLHGAVILTKNKSIGVDFVTVGAACNVTIMGYFE